MNPFELMELKKETFTPKELYVYEVIGDYTDNIIRSSVDRIAEKIGVSQPTLTRFCKKLGYNGFNDFKMAVYKYRKEELSDDSESLFSKYALMIKQIDTFIDPTVFADFLATIQRSRAIILTGMHKSVFPAKLLHYNLQKLGHLSIFESFDEQLEITHYAQTDDLLVIFSASGKNLEMLLNSVAENQAKIAIITGKKNSKLAKQVDFYFEIPSIFNTPNYYVENCVIAMIFADYVTSSLSQHE